jgi:hypothetical protein
MQISATPEKLWEILRSKEIMVGGGPPIYTKIFSGLVMVGINNCFYCCCKTWTMMGLLHTCLGNKLLTWDNGSCPTHPSHGQVQSSNKLNYETFHEVPNKGNSQFHHINSWWTFWSKCGTKWKTSSLGGRSPPSPPFHPGRGKWIIKSVNMFVASDILVLVGHLKMELVKWLTVG